MNTLLLPDWLEVTNLVPAVLVYSVLPFMFIDKMAYLDVYSILANSTRMIPYGLFTKGLQRNDISYTILARYLPTIVFLLKKKNIEEINIQ